MSERKTIHIATIGELEKHLRARNLELRLDLFANEWTATLLHQGMVRSQAKELSMEYAILKALAALPAESRTCFKCLKHVPEGEGYGLPEGIAHRSCV